MVRNPFKKPPTGPEPHELTKKILEDIETENKNRESTRSTSVFRKEMRTLRGELYNKETEKDWEQLQRSIEENKSRSEAYVNWETGLNQLVDALKIFVRAMRTFWPWGNVSVMNPSWDKANTDNLKVTPNVQYYVGLDADGCLKTEVNIKKKHADGTIETVAAPFEQERIFDELLKAWADENDHEVVPDPAHPGREIIKNKTTGVQLDAAALTALKTDLNFGFGAWLGDKLALKVEETDTLRTPAP